MDLIEGLKLVAEAVGPDEEAAAVLTRLRAAVRSLDRKDEEIERLRQMLARTPAIIGADGLAPAAEAALDGLIASLGARRGMVGIAGPDGWEIVVARDLEASDLDDPTAQVSRTVVERALASDEPVIEDDARSGALAGQHSVRALGLRSVLCTAFDAPNGRGFLYVDNHRVRGLFDERALDAANAWLPLLSSALSSASRREQPASDEPFPGYVTRNPELRARLTELARVAGFDASILLLGETGTGKSLLAQQVHARSPRRKGPMVHVNCGALPETLIEAELFGAKKGAFTGAEQDRMGRFEAADKGTLFLDEINSMPEACQVKLLVALQERRITPLGSSKSVPVDVRVIAAMNDLHEGRGLREDLYFRLAVFPLTVPPLRERPEDIPALAQSILNGITRRYGMGGVRLSPEALDQLLAHSWPGNVRELENALDRAVLLADDGCIARLDLRAPPGPTRPAVAATAPPAPLAAGVPSGGGFRPAPQTSRRMRSRVTEQEFRQAWEQGDGHALTVAELLGVRERSVYRLKKKYLTDPS